MCVNGLAQCLCLLHFIIIIIVALVVADINTVQLDRNLLEPWDYIYGFSCTPDVTQDAICTLMKAFRVSG